MRRGPHWDDFLVQAVTFLGPDEHWKEPWTIPANKGEQRANANTTLLQDWVSNGN